jgi:hypothetical protein
MLEADMCVAVIGGMDRLKKHYLEEAKKVGVQLKVFLTLTAWI